MPTFRVTWETQSIEAETACEAALMALATLQDPNSQELIFDVQNHDFHGIAGSVRHTQNTGFSRINLSDTELVSVGTPQGQTQE